MLLLALRIYVSEHRAEQIHALQSMLTRSPATLLLETHSDAAYRRTGFTLLSRNPQPLAAAVRALAGEVVQWPLANHSAAHPRLGVLDHVSCHAVEDQGRCYNADAAAELARNVSTAIAEQSIPVYTYGDAHESHRRLQDLRRAFGYFQATDASEDLFTGVPKAVSSASPNYATPEGHKVHPTAGICCVGAVPWIQNFNVLIDTTAMSAARQVARAVSGRYGGLPHVESMALRSNDGVEIACNLLRPLVTPPDVVFTAVEAACRRMDLAVLKAYTINVDSMEAERRFAAFEAKR